jgi:hypothetical protein
MEPKEKAKELVEKYFDTCHKSSDLELSWKVCKRCALIAVEEIIKEKQECHKFECYGNDIEYWQQVKIEIVQL